MGQPSPQPGPFRVDALSEDDRYELSHGHPIYCHPAGGRHGSASVTGTLPLATDPGVEEVGLDTGYAIAPDVLRVPDLAVGNVPAKPGWVQGVPPLAVEYADTGTDEADLRQKVGQLLAAGTRWVWVVRLVGPRRVEVHAANQPMSQAGPGQVLTAPGLLRNPVRIEELYDRDAALEANLRNLLQRRGFESLEQVQASSQAQGEAKTLLRLLERKGFVLSMEQRQRILDCMDPAQRDRWIDRVLTAQNLDDVLA